MNGAKGITYLVSGAFAVLLNVFGRILVKLSLSVSTMPICAEGKANKLLKFCFSDR